MKTIRAFAALPTSQCAQEQLGAAIQKWKQYPVAVRWVAADRVHLTLKFFGDVDQSSIEAINGALSKAALAVEPFHLELGLLGVFPSWKRPRVLWIAPKTVPQPLLDLHREVEKSLEPLGFAPEGRPFQPHITIGRVKRSAGIEQLTAQLRAQELLACQPYRVDHLRLYRSLLRPSGAVYSVLETFPFNGG